ncbi:MAG: hypothetical protein JST37_08335 [Bacteroidetes bacterium]|nr:hypothetical protein [Bacteroidota bacterium]
MKLLLPLFIFILVSSQAKSQDVPEPDFSQKPYFLVDGKLINMEKTDASLEKKMRGMGYGGVEYFYSVAGNRSSSRVTASSIPKIIYKNDDNSDPSESILVCIGEPRKGSRRFSSFRMSAFGSSKGVLDNRIKLTVKKIRDKIFEITIDQPLSPGEYAVLPYSKGMSMTVITTGTKVNCFGVD